MPGGAGSPARDAAPAQDTLGDGGAAGQLEELRPSAGRALLGRVLGLKSVPTRVLQRGLSGQLRCDQAKAVDVPHVDSEALKKLSKNNEKRARKQDAFLASERPMEQKPRTPGPGLTGAGKVPPSLAHGGGWGGSGSGVHSQVPGAGGAVSGGGRGPGEDDR